MKKMRLTLLVLFALGLVACGSAEPTATPPPPTAVDTLGCATEEVFCVGFITDVGLLDDKSYNQSVWEGVLQSEFELGAKVDFIETKDAAAMEANFDEFIQKNYDVIVNAGFVSNEIIVKKAKANPGIYFIGVDQFHAESLPNLVNLNFPADEAGYLAGALAGMMTKSNIVGAVLGPNTIPDLVAFKEGFEAGVKDNNAEATVLATYHPSTPDVAFNDPQWGATTAVEQLGQGADVIFAAAGSTGIGSLQEVAKSAGDYCIGVDTDQWFTVEEAQPCLLSSAMKLITPGVFELIQLAQEDNFPSGNYAGEVGLAPFHDFEEVIPAEVKAKLEEIDAGLKDGSISTGYQP